MSMYFLEICIVHVSEYSKVFFYQTSCPGLYFPRKFLSNILDNLNFCASKVWYSVSTKCPSPKTYQKWIIFKKINCTTSKQKYLEKNMIKNPLIWYNCHDKLTINILHCGKKIRELPILRTIERGIRALLVAAYEYFLDYRKQNL